MVRATCRGCARPRRRFRLRAFDRGVKRATLESRRAGDIVRTALGPSRREDLSELDYGGGELRVARLDVQGVDLAEKQAFNCEHDRRRHLAKEVAPVAGTRRAAGTSGRVPF